MLTDPILLDHDGDVHPPCGRWLARAEQARRIARILSSTDAEIADGAVFTDQIAPADLDELLVEVEQEAVRIAAELRSGQLTPCPELCSSGGGCSHPGICWASS